MTASVNYVWGVNSANSIYKCVKPCTGSNWVHIAGRLKQIDAGDEEVWGVNSADQIWKRPVDGSGSWRLISGRLKHVSASGNGYIWGVNSNDQIFKCKKPCTGSWISVDGRLKQIDGGYAYVYGVNSANDIFTRPVDWKWVMATYSWQTEAHNSWWGRRSVWCECSEPNLQVQEAMHWTLGEGGGITVTV